MSSISAAATPAGGASFQVRFEAKSPKCLTLYQLLRQNGDDRGCVWEVTAKTAMTGEMSGRSLKPCE